MKAIVCSLAVVAAVLLPCQFSRAQAPEPSHDGLSLSEWIRGTNHPSAIIREYAANEIGEMGPAAKVAVPALIRLLHDDENDVRASAAKALGAMGPAAKEAVRPLIDELDDPWRYVSDSAAVALGKIGPDAKPAVPALVNILRREWVANRRHAAEALGKIGPQANAAAVPLAEAAIDDDSDLREAAFAALIGIRAESKIVVSVFAKHLGPNEADEQRSYALKALRNFGQSAKDAIPDMAKLLEDKSLRQEAFAALTDLGPAARPVLPQLVATARELRSGENAEEHLPSRTECVRLICQWMHDGLPSARTNAERLWNVLGAEALPSVAPLLKSESTVDRDLAIDKFYESAEAAVPTLVDLVKGSEPEARRTAIRILEHIGPAAKAAVPALVTTLEEKDSDDRSVAAIALGEIGADSAPAVAALIEALTDRDGDVRVCAIEALSRIGPAAAPGTAGLIERLHDARPVVRSAAARALGQIGRSAKAALPELQKLARDREDYVRQAAEEAVKAISSAKPIK